MLPAPMRVEYNGLFVEYSISSLSNLIAKEKVYIGGVFIIKVVFMLSGA